MIELFSNINLLNLNEIIILALAIIIDIFLGELHTKIHPLVFIGNSIDYFSKYLLKFKNRWSGLFLTVLVLISIIILYFIIINL